MGPACIAYHYVNQRARSADELTVIAPVLLTNYINHTTNFDWHELTPLCVLLGEEIVVAVNSDSGNPHMAAISPMRSSAIQRRSPSACRVSVGKTT